MACQSPKSKPAKKAVAIWNWLNRAVLEPRRSHQKALEGLINSTRCSNDLSILSVQSMVTVWIQNSIVGVKILLLLYTKHIHKNIGFADHPYVLHLQLQTIFVNIISSKWHIQTKLICTSAELGVQESKTSSFILKQSRLVKSNPKSFHSEKTSPPQA